MVYNPQKVNLRGRVFERFISPERIARRVEEMAGELTDRYAGREPLFLSVLKGAYIFTADLCRSFGAETSLAFIKASSYEGMRSTGDVRFAGLEGLDLRDREVLVIEDIVDSGATLHALMPVLRGLGASGVEICTLLLKPTELRHSLPGMMVGFEIPSAFVVGYGLDYDELGRNLAGIYKLAE